MTNKTTSKLIALPLLTAILSACNSGIGSSTTNPAMNTNKAGATSANECPEAQPWEATKTYIKKGNVVSYNGKKYTNGWWTQGDRPDLNSGDINSGKVWTLTNGCSDNPGDDPVVDPEQGESLPTPIIFTPQSHASGTIYYHLELPYGSGTTPVEELHLSSNYTDLMISNYVAGALLGRLMREKHPQLHFNRDYIYGTLFAQLLQENIDTAGYDRSTNWINPKKEQRDSLLASGQGGPYQINDYSKRLENETGVGLVNFITLQKGLDFTVEAQDNGSQTARKGPVSLDNKYFGPMAAAYFHFNDMNRLAMNNNNNWGPQHQYYEKCMANLSESRATEQKYNMYDIILNAAYNAGTYSEMLNVAFRVCAGMYTNYPETAQIASLGDYTLSDGAYKAAVGPDSTLSSGTFILYPRQIRIYLDQIYNQETFKSPAITGTNVISFSLQDVEYVFQNAFSTLAYVDKSKHYVYISQEDTKAAFEQALESNKLHLSSSLEISKTKGKDQFFKLLDDAINNLASKLNIDFATTTQTTIDGPEAVLPNCPTDVKTYPEGRDKYVSGSIVKGSDDNLYACKTGLAGWCNSHADWAYAPVGATASKDAWALYRCKQQ